MNGVSPEQLALAYQGEHSAKLHWSKDPVSVAEPVTLTLDSRKQIGIVDNCNGGQLSVSVNFSLKADDGALIESGQGTLSAAPGMLQPATFSGSGQRFLVVGHFSLSAGKLIVSGTLEPRVDAGTGGSADFSSAADGFAGAGGI